MSYLTLINALYKNDFERRLKTCLYCSVQFSDVTQRNLRNSCCSEHQLLLAVLKRKEKGSYIRSEEQNKALAEKMKKIYEDNPEIKEKISAAVSFAFEHENLGEKQKAGRKRNNKIHWTKTEIGRLTTSIRQKGKPKSLKARHNMSLAQSRRIKKSRETYTSALGGFRQDLNHYFRSNWEANFARILNFHNRQWKYEPKTFQLTETLSYTPDFFLEDENIFYEIKGRFTEKCYLQIQLFKEKFPEFNFKVIDYVDYEILRKTYKNVILNWEGK